MQRAERRRAEREGRAARTLQELDYLLGVSDVSRLGALRFRHVGEEVFQSPTSVGVPNLVELGRLLEATERISRDEETDEDLQLIFAPGSSLGGARPKASVIDHHQALSIAKFPKETDEYSIELWESVAINLTQRAGIRTPDHESLDEATCDVDLALSSAEYFGLSVKDAKGILKEVAAVTATWREVAGGAGATQSEIRRVGSAFEHNDLSRALAL